MPKINIPTLVGRPKFTKVLPTSSFNSQIYVGPKENLRGLLSLSSPIERGIIQNVEDMHHIWDYINSELKINKKETPVMLTEPINNPKSSRKAIADSFLEKYGAPGILIVQQPILSLLGQGRTTGVVLESGDGVTQVMPIYEGYSLPNTAEKCDLGGSDITTYLRLLLKRSGHNFNTPSELEILKAAKESIISCKPNSIEDEGNQKKKEEEGQSKPYALPDGTLINIGSEKTKAAEIMFKPSTIGFEGPGVHQLIFDSVKKADMDLRDSLYKNIVLAGGNTNISGFLDRLGKEMTQIIAKSNSVVNFLSQRSRFTLETIAS